MNKLSLEKELKQLKTYLKDLEKAPAPPESTEAKIISHTLVGMIMTIHNLIKTGAYDQLEHTPVDLFNLVQEARNNAIHYGYFNDLNNILPQAKNIINNMPNSLKSNFANSIPNLYKDEEVTYYQLTQNEKTTIQEVVSPIGFYRFKTLKGEEELYIKKEDLIIVKNQLNNKCSYLIKNIESEDLFYKANSKTASIKVSFNSMLNSNFLKQFKVEQQKGKVDNNIKKLLNFLEENPYRNGVVVYKYNDKVTNVTIQNVLKELVYNRTIEEKIIKGNFDIKDYDKIHEIEPPTFTSLPIKEMCDKASLTDIFYMELFIKRYQRYSRLKQELDNNQTQHAAYSKQSLLINLFEVGASSFSDKFLTFDKKGDFYKLYHDYKKTRNELAHSAITTPEEKEQLIKNLEIYSESFYNVINKVYKNFLKEKSINNKSKLPNAHALDLAHDIIYNKTSKFLVLKHTGSCKLINGKKYLQLETESGINYIDVTGTLLSLDYNTMSSRECIVPINSAIFADITLNNKIQKSTYKIPTKETLDVDQCMDTLIQAQYFLSSYPQYSADENGPIFSAITIFDEYNNPIYTEGLKHLIHRRFAQKIVPSQLLEASNIVIPKDIDEPILILNKKKELVAKAYLAHLDKNLENTTLTQYLKNKTQKTIEYGKLLPKDLKTNEITKINEVKQNEKRNGSSI